MCSENIVSYEQCYNLLDHIVSCKLLKKDQEITTISSSGDHEYLQRVSSNSACEAADKLEDELKSTKTGTIFF